MLSIVWTSLLAASAALSSAGCDEAHEGIDPYADEEVEQDDADGRAVRFTPPKDETIEDIAAQPDDPIFCACTDVVAPVCGVDGETYDSPCEAGCAGVEVEHEGPCECVCALVWDPVCGADGSSYGNACAADCAGVPVAHPGVCTGDTCTSDDFCAPNQYCRRDGDCDGEGHCEIRPDNCVPDPGQPVCGCDGEAYASGCIAHAFGVSVAGDGPCAVQPPPEF